MDIVTDVQAMRAEYAATVNANTDVASLIHASENYGSIFPVSGDMVASIRRGDNIDVAYRTNIAANYC